MAITETVKIQITSPYHQDMRFNLKNTGTKWTVLHTIVTHIPGAAVAREFTVYVNESGTVQMGDSDVRMVSPESMK